MNKYILKLQNTNKYNKSPSYETTLVPMDRSYISVNIMVLYDPCSKFMTSHYTFPSIYSRAPHSQTAWLLYGPSQPNDSNSGRRVRRKLGTYVKTNRLLQRQAKS